MAQLLVPIPESMATLGDIGRTTLWKLVKANELKQVKIGRRSFITADSLQAYVDRLRESGDSAGATSDCPVASDPTPIASGATTAG